MPRGLKAISIPPDNRFNRPLMLRFAPSRKLALAFITGGRLSRAVRQLRDLTHNVGGGPEISRRRRVRRKVAEKGNGFVGQKAHAAVH